MNIIINSPSYSHSSGGIRVLHYLGFLSHILGHKVNMCTPYLNLEWANYSQKVDYPDFQILPEISPISDGKLNTVRWVLYFPGVLGNGPKWYPDHEYVVSYHKEYLNASQKASNQPQIDTFMLPYLDMSGIDDPIVRANKGIVWHGKGPMIHPSEIDGLPIITRNWPDNRRELIHRLKSSFTLYSFDRFTIMNSEAVLCGCNVMLWNGEKFEPYYPNDPGEGIMNICRDLISVSEFLESIKKHFDIKNN